MILKRSALYIGQWLYNNVSEEQKEKMKNNNKELKLQELQNKVKVLILYIAVAATLVFSARIFDLWLEMLISFVTFAVVRWWNGGHHFAIDWCYIVTNGVIIGVIPLSYIVEKYSLIALVISLILILVYAPFGTHLEKYNRKKVFSLFICIAAYLLNPIALTMVFVLSFDLIKKRR